MAQRDDVIRLRYDGHHIHNLATGDIDIRRSRALLRDFRLHYRRLQKCATCFQRPTQTFSLPCRCFCNCLDCDRVMTICSMCQQPIRASIRCSLAT